MFCLSSLGGVYVSCAVSWLREIERCRKVQSSEVGARRNLESVKPPGHLSHVNDGVSESGTTTLSAS